jgi:16S rRNA (adenine1518-N6/adenine1519-N6)-dimethyltransferase
VTAELLEQAGVSPKRKFGQNFVVDANITAKIARLAGVAGGDLVLEIGPGLGALTEALLEAGARVTALEIDEALVEILRSRAELDAADIVLGDALEADLVALTGQVEGPWSCVANLPYNVATPLVLRILEDVPSIRRLLVMVQSEVADRLVAGPRDAAYGGVSVRVAYHATASIVGKVPPSVFYPRPRVDSALVAIERRAVVKIDPEVASEDEIFAIVKTAFAQRRKMLRRSLAGVVDEAAFAAAGVAPTARPEELDVDAFASLAAAIR